MAFEIFTVQWKYFHLNAMMGIIFIFIFRQVALKALNERLTKAEGQSNWPTLLDDEGKESTGKEEEKKEETKLPIPEFKENSAEG